MGAMYWFTRFLLASGTLFMILIVIELVNGRPSTGKVLSTLLWSVAATAIFIGSKYWRVRKAQQAQSTRIKN